MFQDVGGSTDELGDAEKPFSLEEMLHDIMLYWLPNAAASAARMYWEMNQVQWASPGSIEAPLAVPTGLSIMPGEYVRRSRRWAERRYTNLVLFNEVARGGHFALLEQPELLTTVRSKWIRLRCRRGASSCWNQTVGPCPSGSDDHLVALGDRPGRDDVAEHRPPEGQHVRDVDRVDGDLQRLHGARRARAPGPGGQPGLADRRRSETSNQP